MKIIRWSVWFCAGTLKWARYKCLDYIARKHERALLSNAMENLYTAYMYNRLYSSLMAKQLKEELVRLDRDYTKLRLGLENLYQKRDKYQLPEYVPLRDFK